MLTVEQIENAILQLPSNEIGKLLEWLLNLDYQRWDVQLEKDISHGKLDALAAEAMANASAVAYADFESGNYREI
ncbi:MAG: hypothetical protein JGK17_21345 [Microcoleus sp. PH2017_10_PVI_O_A]|uniref:hypothetical protein n=1 Tax=unclassified Microcoleus TaxID=2642155 RepID=UPI001DD0E31B|nr:MULTISPECIES: hypothetical protein [unclassified Microcoleus]TAE76598.1 MAG: hypothetical protein EAZ83_28035 [Oscillatoriales cyanobacterium]MCC3408083.1 hypothetical protein [Microcoleus sp. PH2017_10_PVI_O_A]MCC3462203.1 hypothetical protein [Microcoleus sp. PH2017_11_PCY_U_A]MCC3480634.1 hypothetical protein [Microcoleus sp. PH2017_12_PCY_D_A]MCC3531332.1 hypothetical protein [Microcoleus sp. PH2017_21_RUC_O_A]